MENSHDTHLLKLGGYTVHHILLGSPDISVQYFCSKYFRP